LIEIPHVLQTIQPQFRCGLQAFHDRFQNRRGRPKLSHVPLCRVPDGEVTGMSANQCRAERPEDREQVMPGALIREPYKIFLSPALLGAALLVAMVASAQAQYLGREQDITDLRLGQRVMVDDGTCPAGQVKEVSGAKMTPNGVARSAKCVPRFGPKTK
jgi:hypothetical protein